ncbi:hypothetical protein ACFQE5_15825 [Pseudonocardia hispaniensis]|uniref:Thioesterase superfamily protein n=1 Tax=Pseudonocardia hispaniensis TaxID=904933 RepID=A0ABW1J5G2_9PSEU
MFAVQCPRHRGPVLLDVSRIRRVTNLGDGVIVVELLCYDGEPLVLLSGAQVSARSRERRSSP